MMWKSVAVMAAFILTLSSSTYVAAQESPATQKSLAEQLVDAFNAVYGVHPGIRANHAKGAVLEGTFMPSASAASAPLPCRRRRWSRHSARSPIDIPT